MKKQVEERTSKRVASDAGKLLRKLATCPDGTLAVFWWMHRGRGREVIVDATAKPKRKK